MLGRSGLKKAQGLFSWGAVGALLVFGFAQAGLGVAQAEQVSSSATALGVLKGANTSGHVEQKTPSQRDRQRLEKRRALRYQRYTLLGHGAAASDNAQTRLQSQSQSLSLANPQAGAGLITYSGKITLPDNYTAPAGGLNIDVFACDSDENCAVKNVSISAGGQEVAYQISAPGTSVPHMLSYYCYNCSSPLVREGFLDPASAQASMSSYQQQGSHSGSGQHYTNLMMPMSTGNTTFTGTVHLPSGYSAPASGHSFTVSACTVAAGFTCNTHFVTITSGNTQVNYDISFTGNATTMYYLDYYCWTCSTFTTLDQAFYDADSPLTTTAISSDADGFYGGASYSGKDMTVLLNSGNSNAIFSGTISVPDGMTAPSGGLLVEVSACDASDYCENDSISIPSGGVQAGFSIDVASAGSSTQWYLKYTCTNCDSPFVSEGYFDAVATNNTTHLESGADWMIGGTNHANRDMTLLLGDTLFSGDINVPSGFTVPGGGVTVSVSACQVGGDCLSEEVTISSGGSPESYSLATIALSSSPYYITYECVNCAPPLLGEGYYSFGSLNSTNFSSVLKTSLATGVDHSGKSMTLLTGSEISGTVTSPVQTGAGGFDVEVSAVLMYAGVEHTFTDLVSLAQNATTASYSVVVPSSVGSVLVKYLCGQDDCASSSSGGSDDFISEGFYAAAETGTTIWDVDSATPVPAASNQSGIDLTLLQGAKISGVLSLPAAHSGSDIGFVVYAYSSTHDYFSGDPSVVFPSGSSSAAYTVVVPNFSDTVVVGYMPASDTQELVNPNYFPTGFYAGSSTVPNMSSATGLSAMSGDQPGINMTVLSGNTLDGKVKLPGGQTASKEIKLIVFADTGENGVITPDDRETTYDSYYTFFNENTVGKLNHVEVTIPKGSSEANFSLRISPSSASSWRLSYGCLSCDGYESPGFHETATQTGADPAAAAYFSGGANYSDAHLNLLAEDGMCFPIKSNSGKVAVICL